MLTGQRETGCKRPEAEAGDPNVTAALRTLRYLEEMPAVRRGRSARAAPAEGGGAPEGYKARHFALAPMKTFACS
jgi:hypothetical protein